MKKHITQSNALNRPGGRSAACRVVPWNRSAGDGRLPPRNDGIALLFEKRVRGPASPAEVSARVRKRAAAPRKRPEAAALAGGFDAGPALPSAQTWPEFSDNPPSGEVVYASAPSPRATRLMPAGPLTIQSGPKT